MPDGTAIGLHPITTRFDSEGDYEGDKMITTTYFEDGNPLGVMVEYNGITVVADSRELALEELVRELDR